MPQQPSEQDKAIERARNGVFDDRLLSDEKLFDASDEELLGTASPPVVPPDTETPARRLKKSRKKPAA